MKHRGSDIAQPMWQACLLLFTYVTLISGCDQPLSSERLPLPSVPSQYGLIGRTGIRMPAGTCVVLQHPPTQIAGLAPVGEDVALIQRDSIRWPSNTAQLLSAADWSTFNCATFALCELFPLTASDWIEPTAQADNFNRSPAEVLLESFATLVLRQGSHEIGELESREELVNDDIICFETETPSGFQMVHLGRIRKEQGSNLVISKLGTGALIRSSLARITEDYPTARISIYRAGKRLGNPAS